MFQISVKSVIGADAMGAADRMPWLKSYRGRMLKARLGTLNQGMPGNG